MDEADRLELLAAYWREWEYRHKKFWALYTQAILAVSALVVAPVLGRKHLTPAPGFEGRVDLGFTAFPAVWGLWLFPIVAGIVVWYAHAVIKAEYDRFQAVNAGYTDLFMRLTYGEGLLDRYPNHPQRAGVVVDMGQLAKPYQYTLPEPSKPGRIAGAISKIMPRTVRSIVFEQHIPPLMRGSLVLAFVFCILEVIFLIGIK